jgi:hypothetical protein
MHIIMALTTAELYRSIALRYGLESVLNDNITNYYFISGGKANLEGNTVLNEKLHEVVIQSTDENVFAFYVDTLNFEIPQENLTSALGIKEDLLPETLQELDLLTEMIVLHELAHLIDQQNLADELGILLSDCDRIIGGRIAQRAAVLNDDLTHNENFGAVLHNIIRTHEMHDTAASIRSAMSKTLIDIEDAIVSGETNDDFYRC